MDTTTVVDNDLLGTIFIMIAGFSIVIIIFAIICYVLNSVGLYALAKNRGFGSLWIAWIPFLQNYFIGKLIGDRVWGIPEASVIIVVGNFIVFIMNYLFPPNQFLVTSIGTLQGLIYIMLSFILSIYELTAYYKLYKLYSNHPVASLIASMLLPLLSTIIIFTIRNNQPKENILETDDDF